MPYIEQARRPIYNQAIAKLIAEVRKQPTEKQDGDLVYIITALIRGSIDEPRFFKYNARKGVLVSAMDDLNDMKVYPYELEAIKRNGDIDIDEIMKTLEEETK